MNYWEIVKRALLVCTAICITFVCSFGQQSAQSTYDFRIVGIAPKTGVVKIGDRVLYKNSTWRKGDGTLHIAEDVVIAVYSVKEKCTIYKSHSGPIELPEPTTEDYVQKIFHATKGLDMDLANFLSRNQFYMMNDTLYIPTMQLVDENHGFFFVDPISEKYFAASKYPQENQIFFTLSDLIGEDIFKDYKSTYELLVEYFDIVKNERQSVGSIKFKYIPNE